MTKKISIKTKELEKLLNIDAIDFPKYSTQLMNLANQNAQGTRPKIVGQLSDLIQEFTGKTMPEWEAWYLERHPEAIDKATHRISEMITNLKGAINKIDDNLIKKWVKDLVIIKTFIGLRFQEAILKKIADMLEKNYRLADPADEARGIDGYIGDIPVSIKPHTYKIKKALNETIEVKIIYYEKKKKKNELTVYFDDMS